ncbi:hypothetical protein AJ79_02589 [Helicocarpus griseus UAMH5409]|uniref:Uncharacterized protein n=1 Tax=Helicocarpus griseus UAMH5409 TaxID=1447875 RepID=A0A2B7XTX9_9EURO|nr:hypothetical protein AJ79_02589 [Helicocarpus griseus UAMH5409]
MSAVAHRLVRRGLEASSARLAPSHGDNGSNEDTARQISAFALLTFAVTAIGFGLVAFAIQYTYGTVVGVLASVEDPQPDIYTPISDSEDSAKNPKLTGPETPSAQPAPITRSLRSTILHLRARAGPWSRFRGLGLFLCTAICRSILAEVLTFGTVDFGLLESCGEIASDVLTATLELAWVHIVISEPSTKRFWKRVPGYSSWVQIAPAVALRSAASQLSLVLPAQLGLRLIVWPVNQNHSFADPDRDNAADIATAMGVLALSIILTILVEIPATVTMIRVAASILPQEENTIVPFDRTFGGKVQPAVLGGSGKVGLLDAWKTFTWPSRVRLMKVLAKTFAILTVVSFTFAFVFVGEAMFFGKQILSFTQG